MSATALTFMVNVAEGRRADESHRDQAEENLLEKIISYLASFLSLDSQAISIFSTGCTALR